MKINKRQFGKILKKNHFEKVVDRDEIIWYRGYEKSYIEVKLLDEQIVITLADHKPIYIGTDDLIRGED